MNNSRFFIIAVLQILCLFFVAPQAFSQGYGVKTIVIDPGHGGKDPGALGYKGSKEKDIVLKVALLTGNYIEKYLTDVKVLYTRKDDTYPTLKERCDFANEAKADLFISIHANAVGSTRATGAETFVLGTHKTENNLKVAQKENSVIAFEDGYEEEYDFNPNSPESYMIFTFMQRAYQEQSTALATLIQEQYTKRVGRKDREVQQGPFWVLSATSMPAVLTELGFISNPDEERFLTSTEGQEYMASAIFRAVRDYKNDIDSKQSTTLNEAENEHIQAPKEEEVAEQPATTPKVEKKPVVEKPIYKLQILSSAKELDSNNANIKDLEKIDFYKDGKVYKYTIGASDDLKDIIALKKEYRQRFKGCFPIAFYKGQRISISEARKIDQ